MCITKEDNVFPQPAGVLQRFGCEHAFIRKFGIGEEVRDWSQADGDYVIYPYDDQVKTIPIARIPKIFYFIWPYKRVLEDRKVFGGQNYREVDKPWYEYGQIPADRQATPLSIAFAFVATHNHFVLDRGGKVFNRSAPIIKLPPDATEDDHLALLGLLNSSTACFWMQQTFHNKGGPGGGSSKDEKWHDFYEFSGTALLRFPVPENCPIALTRTLDSLAFQFSALSPDRRIRAESVPTLYQLINDRREGAFLHNQMISVQEELDWQCYRLYGLVEESMDYEGDVPPIELGQRAFEIFMARQIAAGELHTKWFTWLQIQPITEIPSHWPETYRQLVERRISLIETNHEIALIEKPDCKRRWELENWDDQQQRALKNWLLDRLESSRYWPDPAQHEPRLQSVAELSDVASGDHDFLQVAAIYRGREDFDVPALVAELVEAEAVPFLPVLRYKPTGLRKRKVWEQVWDLQREEDRASSQGSVVSVQQEAENRKLKTENSIPVPPKYTSADFLKTDFWRLRGKLDVPKEHWISYPHCETESDPSLVVGWAGWNHLQQATALIGYYDARKRDGWDAKRLTPLLAGLDQLLPWIHQWHPEIDPEFGETAGQSYETMLKADAHELGLTLEEIRAWQPPPKKKGGRGKAKK